MPRSVHSVTWASAADAALEDRSGGVPKLPLLTIENTVVMPLGWSRSTSKYGSSSVAAGTLSMVPSSALARAAGMIRASASTLTMARCDIQSPLTFHPDQALFFVNQYAR